MTATQVDTERAETAPRRTSALEGAWWKHLCGLLMAASIFGAFLFYKGSFGFGSGGDNARVVFFHVPSAILASVCYGVGMVFSAMYLFGAQFNTMDVDAKAAICMELGFLFCLLATVTGSIFAGIQWSTFWNWDPRETSIVGTLLLYAAYLLLRGAMAEKQVARARICAVYALVALVPEQFLIWAVPRIMTSNHPTTVLSTPSDNSFDFNLVLYVAFAAFTLLAIWLFELRLRSYRLLAAARGQ